MKGLPVNGSGRITKGLKAKKLHQQAASLTCLRRGEEWSGVGGGILQGENIWRPLRTTFRPGHHVTSERRTDRRNKTNKKKNCAWIVLVGITGPQLSLCILGSFRQAWAQDTCQSRSSYDLTHRRAAGPQSTASNTWKQVSGTGWEQISFLNNHPKLYSLF